MAFLRKYSLTERNPREKCFSDDDELKRRRASLAVYPWMNKLKPLIYGSKNEDVPDCYNRVRYIRDSCKVLSDLWKTDKDFLNKSSDSDSAKAFKEFRSSEVARNYRSQYGSTGAPSILNQTIDDFVQIHDYIDSKRKESLEQFKKIIEQAKDKQATIRQTMTELRDNYEKAQRKLETADGNLKKFQTRSDRLTLLNYDERSNELETTRNECEQSRTLARDIYATETYKIASEEHLITKNIFSQYLFEQNTFYQDISMFLAEKIPNIEKRLDADELAPAFRSDLAKHCSKRYDTTLAYPIEICIRLLQNSLREEGLFRIASAHIKQKKFVAELDLQSIDRGATLNELAYDPHVPANTLKQYLRELPECLLTNALFTQWNEIPSISNEQARIQRIGQLINQLPKINYDNLCYLVRFLSRVAEYSSENKMTASNLGICIGCSILYPQDQTSNSYTNGSTILELMIIHHKQFFPNSSQQEQAIKTSKPPPDLIPTEFHSKSRSGSNENLLDSQSFSGYAQPSPGTRRKNKAPPPPPSTISQQNQVEQQNSPGETANQHLAVTSSSSFTASDKVHRRTPSDGIQLDRPGAPPPLPPPVVVVASPVMRPRERLSIPLVTNSNNQHTEQGNVVSSTEEKTMENDLETSVSLPPMNDGVKVGRLISELNNRMAAAKLNNTPTTSNIRASTIRNSTITSPGETTDF